MAKWSMAAERGFSLIETLVAFGLLAGVVLGLVHSFAFATRANALARSAAFTSILAAAQIDRIRSLTWTFDAAGTRMTDTTTDLTVSPERAGGVGLTPSPVDALSRNAAGYCDFLDAAGRSLGGGSHPPADAAYVRRWRITPLLENPLDALVVEVRVVRTGDPAGSDRAAASEGRMVSVRFRKAWR